MLEVGALRHDFGADMQNWETPKNPWSLELRLIGDEVRANKKRPQAAYILIAQRHSRNGFLSQLKDAYLLCNFPGAAFQFCRGREVSGRVLSDRITEQATKPGPWQHPAEKKLNQAAVQEFVQKMKQLAEMCLGSWQ